MIGIPERLRDIFESGGWYDGRRVPFAAAVPSSHPAATILTSLEGLTIGECKDGETCAASDITFAYVPDMRSDATTIALWSGLLAARLICIGEVHHGHGALLVDDAGRHFTMSLVHDAFLLEGETFDTAMESLLLGRRGRPLLRPDQSSVTCWGEEITSDDPRIYAYPRSESSPTIS